MIFRISVRFYARYVLKMYIETFALYEVLLLYARVPPLYYPRSVYSELDMMVYGKSSVISMYSGRNGLYE